MKPTLPLGVLTEAVGTWLSVCLPFCCPHGMLICCSFSAPCSPVLMLSGNKNNKPAGPYLGSDVKQLPTVVFLCELRVKPGYSANGQLMGFSSFPFFLPGRAKRTLSTQWQALKEGNKEKLSIKSFKDL